MYFLRVLDARNLQILSEIKVWAGLVSSEGHEGKIYSRPSSLAYKQLSSP